MAKRKKGIIITSTCALLAGAAVIAELALGGGTGGNRRAWCAAHTGRCPQRTWFPVSS